MCVVFCFFWGGGLDICFCNFYEINSSQDFFLYCANFGVDGKTPEKSPKLSADNL